MSLHGVLTAIPLATLVAASLGCPDPCGNELLDDVASPDGRRHAVVFTRDCGATTYWSIHVSMLNADERLPKRAGNVVSFDPPRHIPEREFGSAYRATWTSADSLKVTHPELRRTAPARAFHPETPVDDVQITCCAYRQHPDECGIR